MTIQLTATEISYRFTLSGERDVLNHGTVFTPSAAWATVRFTPGSPNYAIDVSILGYPTNPIDQGEPLLRALIGVADIKSAVCLRAAHLAEIEGFEVAGLAFRKDAEHYGAILSEATVVR